MKKSSNKGFTLVELIIVIAILAIIMLIAIPNFSGIQQRMQVRADKASAAQIGKAIRIWYTEYTSDEAFKRAVGSALPIPAWDGEVLKAVGASASTAGKLPVQGEDPDGAGTLTAANLTTAPISLIAKLDEYVDTNMKPTSLRAVNGGARTTVVEDNQYYSACLIGTGTAEKVVVCISDKTLPTVPESGVITVGYTGDGVIDGDALAKFNQTVAYKEP